MSTENKTSSNKSKSGAASKSETKKTSGASSKPETKKTSGSSSKPETKKTSGSSSKPETKKTSGSSSKPETKKTSGSSSKPETKKTSGSSSKPESKKTSSSSSKPETKKTSGSQQTQKKSGSAAAKKSAAVVKPSAKNVNIPNDPYPMGKMCSFCARVLLIVTAVLFPLAMNSTRYSAITKFKGDFFTWTFVLVMIMLLFCVFISSVTKVSQSSPLTKKQLTRPPVVADIAIIAYWVLMLISCLRAKDPQTAFFGMNPRNNGFFFQTMYVGSYFVISRGLIAKKIDARIFALGGALLGVVCTLHFYGVDIYKIAAVNGAAYGGPFWTSTTYRFLGPVGNVNLGSYILSASAIIAAGLYINKVSNKIDQNGVLLLVYFALSFYAELNINTDAGVVALAVAAVLIPAVLLRSMEQFERIAHVYAVAMALLVFNRALVECKLRGEKFGKGGLLMVLALVFFLALSAALRYVNSKGKFRITRRRLTAIGCGFMAAAIIGGLALCYVVSAPDPTTVGSAAGAIKVTERYDMIEKSDSMLHELGQMMRGNFNDKFGHNRLFTWKRTLRLVKLNPMLGIGPDNFKDFFAEYFHDEAVEMFPSSNGGLDKAHNEFLDVLISNGILGLLAYLTFFGALLYYAFRKKNNRGLAPVFGVAVASYMAHAFFGYQLPLHSPVMWMMIGMLANVCRVEADSKLGNMVITE